MASMYFIAFLIIGFVALVMGYIHYSNFSRAIRDAVREHENPSKYNGSLIFIFVVSFALIAYFFIAVPTPESFIDGFVSGGSFLVIVGIFYLTFELPYLLVKMAAKDYVEQLAAAGDDKRQAARMKSAEVLADIVRRKLKVDCQLQALTSNNEFVFLTYIVNNKPIATRLKLNQADNPENWKKLGEWIITNYQTSTSGQ